MAGTLTISTLSDGTNSTSSTNCIQGSAKAWVNFNGSTAAIRASYNVGSITKNGTGNYTVNFSSAMPDANYSIVGSVATVASDSWTFQPNFSTAPAAGSCQVCSTYGTTQYDAPYIRVAIFR